MSKKLYIKQNGNNVFRLNENTDNDIPWFEFNQNNSGGDLDIDDDVNEVVMIQAKDAKDAMERAEAIGIYFDGHLTGRDCECCGPRWWKTWYPVKREELPKDLPTEKTTIGRTIYYPYNSIDM